MKDPSGTNQELIEEISTLKQRIKDLEQLESERKKAEDAQRDSEKRYQRIIEEITDYQYTVRVENGRAVGTKHNPACVAVTGYTAEEFAADPYLWVRMVAPEDRELTIKRVEKILEGNDIPPIEHRIIRKDGELRWVSDNIIPYRNDSGTLLSYDGVVKDITERMRAEEALRKSEERYRLAITATNDGLWEWDIQTNQEFFSPRWCEIIGYSFDDPEMPHTHDSWASRIHTDDYDRVIEVMKNHLENGTEYNVDYRHRHKSGEYHWHNSKGQAIFDEGGKPIKMVGCISDITDRKRAEEALRESENRYRELSIVDELTQLYNSRHFYFQLEMEVARSNRYDKPLTLLLIDLDNFKAFNDAYGHIEGDHVLQRLGKVVKRCLRETDFAYRYGGEEFTILLPMTTSTDGAVTAERIRTEFNKETFSPATVKDVHVTVSIGLAQYKPQEDIKAFVHRVDQLMYQVKMSGKDRVCSES